MPGFGGKVRHPGARQWLSVTQIPGPSSGGMDEGYYSVSGGLGLPSISSNDLISLYNNFLVSSLQVDKL